MSRRRRPRGPILLKGYDDCLLGISFPRANEKGVPVAIYSADMIAARLRDRDGFGPNAARHFVADHIEAQDYGPGTPRICWAATAIDMGAEPDPWVSDTE
jgi:hypothetical protein